MPIVKCATFIEAYRHRARSPDLNELSGRTGRPDLTRFVSEQIVRELSIRKTDTLIDVGCGDGTFLRLASPAMGFGIGILPTSDEIERVRAAMGPSFSNVRIQQGLAQCTNLSAAVGDRVVFNGVVPILTQHEVDAALRELVRISKPDALVFVGEVPFVDEFAGKTYGDSIFRWLWWVLTKQGVSPFVQRLRQTLRACISPDPFIIAPKFGFHEGRDGFVRRAARFGLILKECYPHFETTRDGRVQESETRLDYLFGLERS